MGYRTCYLCKYWNENNGKCAIHNTIKDSTDWCSSIELIPCCASCKHWNKNSDYMDKGNCAVYGNRLSSASDICRADNYIKKL